MENNNYILLIEDNKGISESIIWALEYENYSIVPQYNGSNALEFLSQHSLPRLILLDMMMPIMNGWEFRYHQKLNNDLKNIPTILMSARNDLTKDLILSDNELILPKPFDINELLEMIGKYF